MSRPLIYIAGPYSAMTPVGVRKNIAQAEAIAIELWRDWGVICPHKNTGGFEKYEESHGVRWEDYMDGDLEMVRRVDAVYMMDGWRESRGATLELEEAIRSGKKVYHEKDGFPRAEDFHR